ncbi:hypothetical protein FB567DRAFT_625287 [Paraphoma chrysanthemicola]|uniref:BRCT domain-containing protein n=1 Tax=Paraphoma chrysanthemicola TaxID=798071 RepID=A0A8K0RFH2_9PLEO|nr:hypothetical protein FB567DRAFT_625287 [Paraphoma chrysanthemicola]
MTWTLQVFGGDGSASNTRDLPKDGTAHIVVLRGTQTLAVVHELKPAVHTELGRITTGVFGAKLEAIEHSLNIKPGHGTNEPQVTAYEVLPRVDGRSEIIILRNGDAIASTAAISSLKCSWTPEIQVNSSAADAVPKLSDASDGVAETTPEEDTEDEDLDNTITAMKTAQPGIDYQGTPQLSNQRSVVVQETPTAARTNDVGNYGEGSNGDVGNCGEGSIGDVGNDGEGLNGDETLSAPELILQTNDAEHYSTARTATSPDKQTDPTTIGDFEGGTVDSAAMSDSVIGGVSDDAKLRHPRVLISRKRSSPAVDEQEAKVQTDRKRTRRTIPSDDDTQDSRVSNIIVTTLPVAASAKSRKRKSVAAEQASEVTPSRSQRSVTTPSATSEDYEGAMPCVATSSSSLTDKSQAVKFLKKQGGSLVNSVKEDFNVLCVRDGELHKTPKVLLAIANGTPIVTDKWLLDSAKGGKFLNVKAYLPSVPKQEKEWHFNFLDVAGQPQKVFEGYTVHFTSSLCSAYKTFAEIEQVCKAAGAAKVTKKKMDKSENIIVLAAEEDADAEKLMQDGITCYNRELLPISILRGSLDLASEEFRVGVASSASKPKRRRKS